MMKAFKTPLLRYLGNRCHIHTIAFNMGSSSLKYSMYDVEKQESSPKKMVASALSSGHVERVGKADAVVKASGKIIFEGMIETHDDGLKKIVEHLNLESETIRVVGHRIVHGGSFTQPAVVNTEILRRIDEYSVLAPLHNPPAMAGLKAARALFPDASHVAVFDTAFHSSMPPSSYRYALPTSLYDEYQIRRYGFHGISFKYVSEQATAWLGKDKPNLLLLHLGSGCSMCCVKAGVSIDTTLGFSTVEGLVMGTRPGDLDPGIVSFLAAKGFSPAKIDHILNKESGLLGLSNNYSNDMQLIKQAAAEGNPHCKLAIEVSVLPGNCSMLTAQVVSLMLEILGQQLPCVTAGVCAARAEISREFSREVEWPCGCVGVQWRHWRERPRAPRCCVGRSVHARHHAGPREEQGARVRGGGDRRASTPRDDARAGRAHQ